MVFPWHLHFLSSVTISLNAEVPYSLNFLGIKGTRFRAKCKRTSLLRPFPNIEASLSHKPFYLTLLVLEFPYTKWHRLSRLAALPALSHPCVPAQVCLVSGLCSQTLPVLTEAFAAHSVCWEDSVPCRLQWLRSTESKGAS